MLEKKDLISHYVAHHLCSYLCIFPISISIKTGKMTLEIRRRSWKRLGSYCWFVLASIYGLFIWGRFLQGILMAQYFLFDHIPVQVLNGAVAVFALTSAYHLFIESPEATVAIFNQLLEFDEDTNRHRKKPRYWFMFSKEEVLMLNHAFSFFFFCFGIFVVQQFYYEDSIQYLYSLVRLTPIETEWDTKIGHHWTHLSFVLLESSIYFYYVCMAYSAVLIDIAFRYTLIETLDARIKFITNMTTRFDQWHRVDARAEYQKARELQLELNRFNMAMSTSTFVHKQLLILYAITFFFFGIRLLHERPLVGITWIVNAAFVTILFSVMYDNASKVPGKMYEYKKAILLMGSRKMDQVQFIVAPPQRREMEKVVRSIQNVGIQVGSFDSFDRVSTLRFIGFVTQQVTSLLVAFRK